ncbi:hypothetical protein ACFOWE_24970 [Planomonospora corallina]|uniref:Uncharacterized protein n=1 Tax=Planomonospora corallina TaxID=1806052 RepID=A0ABV8ICF8_9ACTN
MADDRDWDRRSLLRGAAVLADISHSFYKPYNVTLDFTGMNVYIARGRAA